LQAEAIRVPFISLGENATFVVAGDSLQLVTMSIELVQLHPQRLPLQVVLDRRGLEVVSEVRRQLILL